MSQRLGRNESFNHAGNVAAAVLAGLIGYYVAYKAPSIRSSRWRSRRSGRGDGRPQWVNVCGGHDPIVVNLAPVGEAQQEATDLTHPSRASSAGP
jgi:hypothetical protein